MAKRKSRRRKLRRDEMQVGEHIIRLTPEKVALLAKIEYIHYNSPIGPLKETIEKLGLEDVLHSNKKDE